MGGAHFGTILHPPKLSAQTKKTLTKSRAQKTRYTVMSYFLLYLKLSIFVTG
jgi:hypothetical protein